MSFDPSLIVSTGLPFLSHLGGRAYGWSDRRWVDYGGALLFYDHRAACGAVTSECPNLLYHYTYYLIIALSGEYLDRHDLHRLHGLGISYQGNTLLVSMPVNGGKSTLVMSLLDDPECCLISEDTPLVDGHGRIHPFPIRISLRELRGRNIPAEFIREKLDPIFGRKILVDLDYHGLHRIRTAPSERPLVCWGERSDCATPSVRRMHPLRSLYLVILHLTTATGCPQRAEIMLRFSPSGVATLCRIALLRLKAAMVLWRRGRFYHLVVSTDIAANAAFVKDFLRSCDRT